MPDGGITIAILVVKLGAVLGASTGLISLLKWFNTYEFKPKTNGKGKGASDDVESALDAIREKASSRR